MGELSIGDLAGFEVYRSGAHLTLRCERCRTRWPWPTAKIELLKLVRTARGHVCDESIPKAAAP